MNICKTWHITVDIQWYMIRVPGLWSVDGKMKQTSSLRLCCLPFIWPLMWTKQSAALSSFCCAFFHPVPKCRPALKRHLFATCMNYSLRSTLTNYYFLLPPSPGQQAVGVPAQRKGNPSDHRRGERQEAGRQAGQQLNWPHTDSLTPGFQINCYLQNTWCVLVYSLILVLLIRFPAHS